MSKSGPPDDDLPLHVLEAREGTRGRLARTLLAQGIGLGGKLLQQVVLVPLFIAAWGVNVYQDWLILFAAATLLSMCDFGLQIYFGNRLTIAWLDGGAARLNRTLAVAMGCYAILLPPLLAIVAGIAFFTDWIGALGSHALMPDVAMIVFVLLAVSTLAAFPLGVAASVFRARGRFDRSVNFSSFLLLAQTAAAGGALLTRQSPIVVAASMLAVVLAAWIVLWIDLRANYADFRFGVARPKWSEVVDVIRNSGSLTALQAAQAIILSGLVILLGYLNPATGAVVAFNVERTLASVLRLTIQQVSLTFGAEMARQFVHGDGEPLRFLYRNSGRLGAASTGILGGVVLALAGPVVQVWTHGAVEHSPALLLALMAAVILGAPSHPAIVLYVMTNRPRLVAIAAFVQAILLAVLAVPLIIALGPLGAALAWAIAEFLTHGIYLSRVAAKSIGERAGLFAVRALTSASVWLAVSFAVATVIARLLSPTTLMAIFLAVAGWAVVMAPVALFFLLTAEQRRWAVSKLRDRIPMSRRRR